MDMHPQEWAIAAPMQRFVQLGLLITIISTVFVHVSVNAALSGDRV